MDMEDPLLCGSEELIKDEFGLTDDADWFTSEFNMETVMDTETDTDQYQLNSLDNDNINNIDNSFGVYASSISNNSSPIMTTKNNIMNISNTNTNTFTPETKPIKQKKITKSSEKKTKTQSNSNSNSNYKKSKSLTSKVAEIHPESVLSSAGVIRKAMAEGLESLNLDPDSIEGKMKKKQIRNRISAQLHRDHKKLYISDLEREVCEYKQQVSGLKSLLRLYIDENSSLRGQISSIQSTDVALQLAAAAGGGTTGTGDGDGAGKCLQRLQNNENRYILPDYINIPDGTLHHSVVAAIHPDQQLALMKLQTETEDNEVEIDTGAGVGHMGEGICTGTGTDGELNGIVNGIGSDADVDVDVGLLDNLDSIMEVGDTSVSVPVPVSVVGTDTNTNTGSSVDVLKSLRNYYSSLYTNTSTNTNTNNTPNTNTNSNPSKKRRLEHTGSYSEDDAHTSGFESDRSGSEHSGTSDLTDHTGHYVRTGTGSVSDGPEDYTTGNSSDDGSESRSGSDVGIKWIPSANINTSTNTHSNTHPLYHHDFTKNTIQYTSQGKIDGSGNSSSGSNSSNSTGSSSEGVMMFSFLFLFSFAFWGDLNSTMGITSPLNPWVTTTSNTGTGTNTAISTIATTTMSFDWQNPLDTVMNLWEDVGLSSSSTNNNNNGNSNNNGNNNNNNYMYDLVGQAHTHSNSHSHSHTHSSTISTDESIKALVPTAPATVPAITTGNSNSNSNSLVSKLSLSPNQLQLSLESESESSHQHMASIGSMGSLGRVLLQSEGRDRQNGRDDTSQMIKLTPEKFIELYNTYVSLLNTVIQQQVHLNVNGHVNGHVNGDESPQEGDLSKQLWVYPPTTHSTPLYSTPGGTGETGDSQEHAQETQELRVVSRNQENWGNNRNNTASSNARSAGNTTKPNTNTNTNAGGRRYLRERGSHSQSQSPVDHSQSESQSIRVYTHQMEQLKTLHSLLRRYQVQHTHRDKAAAVSVPVAVAVPVPVAVPLIGNGKQMVGSNTNTINTVDTYTKSTNTNTITNTITNGNTDTNTNTDTPPNAPGVATSTSSPTYTSRVLVTTGKALLHPNLASASGGPSHGSSSTNDSDSSSSSGNTTGERGRVGYDDTVINDQHMLKLLLPASSIVWGGSWPTGDSAGTGAAGPGPAGSSIIPSTSSESTRMTLNMLKLKLKQNNDVNGSGHDGNDTVDTLGHGLDTDTDVDVDVDVELDNMWVEVNCNIMNTKLINDLTILKE